MHLLALVADRLWLVKGGAVTPYDRGSRGLPPPASGGATRPRPRRAARSRSGQPRGGLLALQAEVRKCEERLAKLNEMRDKLAKKLADPALYEDAREGELETWNAKYAEVMEALDRAEAMWLAAAQKLEAAEA